MSDDNQQSNRPHIDESLIPRDKDFEKVDYITMIIRLSEHQRVSALVGIENDNILMEAFGNILYRAYNDEDFTLVDCPDVQMMAMKWEDFLKYMLQEDSLDPMEKKEVKEDMSTLHERILETRDNMQNPHMN